MHRATFRNNKRFIIFNLFGLFFGYKDHPSYLEYKTTETIDLRVFKNYINVTLTVDWFELERFTHSKDNLPLIENAIQQVPTSKLKQLPTPCSQQF